MIILIVKKVFTKMSFCDTMCLMRPDSLTAVGLTTMQAEAYVLLFELGEVRPPQAASHLGISRTNAYKVLDKLVEMRLAKKTDDAKKLIYSPANPLALADLTAKYRARAKAREDAAGNIMQTLLKKYYEHVDSPEAKSAVGRQAVAELYRQQIALKEDIHFVHAKADVTSMGYETMHELRVMPGRNGNQRHGILSVDESSTINHDSHKKSNLAVTWLETGMYTAPVEWSATNSSLLIVVYSSEPQALLITNPFVGSAFIEMWKMLSSFIKNQPTHKRISTEKH